MTEDKRPDPVLAAEYVLGLLEGEELMEARAREGSDAAFAAEVAQWQDRLAPLADEIDPRWPHDEVWHRIVDALETEPAVAEVVALRRKVRRWQWIGGAAIAASVAIAVFSATFLTMPTNPAPQSPPLAAVMPIEGTPLRIDFTYLPDRESLLVTAVGLTADGVHDHEIWLVPEQGELVSLGLVTPGVVTAHSVPEEIGRQIAGGSQLLLTREPLGGKPPTQDAGPVVAEARFTAI